MAKRTRDERFKEMAETDVSPVAKRRAGLERLIRPANGFLDQLTDDVLISIIRLCIDYGYGVCWIPVNQGSKFAPTPALLTVSKHVSWAFKVAVIQHVQAMIHTYRSQWKATEGYMAYPLVDVLHGFRMLTEKFAISGPMLLRYVAGNVFRAPISLEQWKMLLGQKLIHSGVDMTQRLGKLLRSYIPQWSGRFAENCMNRVSFVDLLLASLFENVDLEWTAVFDVWWHSDNANPEDLHWLWPVLRMTYTVGKQSDKMDALLKRKPLHTWSLSRHVYRLFPELASVDTFQVFAGYLPDFYHGKLVKTTSAVDWDRTRACARIIPDIRVWARMLNCTPSLICPAPKSAKDMESLGIIMASPRPFVGADDWAEKAVETIVTMPSKIVAVVEDTGLVYDLVVNDVTIGTYQERCLQFIRAYIRKHRDEIIAAGAANRYRIFESELAMKLVAEQVPVGPLKRETQPLRIQLITRLMSTSMDLTAFDIQSSHPASPGEYVFDIRNDHEFLRSLFSVKNLWRLNLGDRNARNIIEYVQQNVVIDETVMPASHLVSCAYQLLHEGDERSRYSRSIVSRMFFDLCPPSILNKETFHQCLALTSANYAHVNSDTPVWWLEQFHERLAAKERTFECGPFLYPTERVTRTFAPFFAYGWYLTVASLIDHYSKMDTAEAMQLRLRYLETGVNMGLFDSFTVLACVVADDQTYDWYDGMTMPLPALDHATLDVVIRCGSFRKPNMFELMKTLKRMPGAIDFLGASFPESNVQLIDLIALQNVERL